MKVILRHTLTFDTISDTNDWPNNLTPQQLTEHIEKCFKDGDFGIDDLIGNAKVELKVEVVDANNT